MQKIGTLSSELQSEAEAFDEQIKERIQNGHIPDLRLTQPCDWFRNNVWRRPYYVNILIGRVLRFCLSHLSKSRDRILEVGCGTGFMSLELARNGFNVTGLDISTGALQIAEEMREKNPFKENMGSLRYICTDLLDWSLTCGEKFDVIVFFGALHHFSDPSLVLDRVKFLLEEDGRVIAYEPARDWWTEADAAILALVRALLSVTGHWYEDISLPDNSEDIRSLILNCLDEVQEAKPKGEPEQSPLDNSSNGTEMLRALRDRFKEVAFEPDIILFDRVVAGTRFSSEKKCRQLADFFHAFEVFALKSGLMSPGGFLFAGQKHGEKK